MLEQIDQMKSKLLIFFVLRAEERNISVMCLVLLSYT